MIKPVTLLSFVVSGSFGATAFDFPPASLYEASRRPVSSLKFCDNDLTSFNKRDLRKKFLVLGKLLLPLSLHLFYECLCITSAGLAAV